MRKPVSIFVLIFIFNVFSSQNLNFPYGKFGLTKEQAAAHLLSRFTFGAKPNQVQEVAKMGLENWFQQQLNSNLNDDDLNQRLSKYDLLDMDNETIANTFPRPGKIANMLKKEMDLKKDSLNKKDLKELAKKYLDEHNLRPIQDLVRQTIAQKYLHAIYGNNQLQEVMTDFWFNHFNVSLTKVQAMQFVYTFERDAIRPNSLGNFLNLLTATAKNPAMSLYLDNTTSVSDNNPMYKAPKNPNKKEGLNENYARELMELHTLGVDGGYTQKDVTEVAKTLTGWTIFPFEKDSPQRKLLERFQNQDLSKQGFVIEKNFIFRANKHDQSEKTILGENFPSGHGYDEGLRVLKMLSENPSTAKFISKKLATRFVSDNPPQSLVDKMANTFLKTKGNIKEVLATMANSEEFWGKDALREKIKSPFELIASTARATNADVKAPFLLQKWSEKMGQKVYYYQAPTGFPDKAQYWINTGALLNRMNFGLAFASGKIAETSADFLALNQNHEPESAEKALEIYSKILMPERNLSSTIEKLKPMLNDPEIQKKIESSAGNDSKIEMSYNDDEDLPKNRKIFATANPNPEMLSQVVGIIVGSPEFQRR